LKKKGFHLIGWRPTHTSKPPWRTFLLFKLNQHRKTSTLLAITLQTLLFQAMRMPPCIPVASRMVNSSNSTPRVAITIR
jgi:hypothetical protein